MKNNVERRITGADPYIRPDAKDEAILARNLSAWNKHSEPRVGDYVKLVEDQSMKNSRIIKITPDLERRVLMERRTESRERITDLERRLSRIAELLERDPELLWSLGEIAKLARGPLRDSG